VLARKATQEASMPPLTLFIAKLIGLHFSFSR
jgi:hypothetical protein